MSLYNSWVFQSKLWFAGTLACKAVDALVTLLAVWQKPTTIPGGVRLLYSICWCWERQWGDCGNKVLASVAEWNQVQERSVMLNKSLCLLSDGSRHFTLRVTNSLPHRNTHGGTLRELCGLVACMERHTLTHTLTQITLFFLHLIYTQSISFRQTYYIPVGANSKHSACACILSKALQRAADRSRGRMSELVFAHIDWSRWCPLVMLGLFNNWTVAQIRTGKHGLKQNHWWCRFCKLAFNLSKIKGYENAYVHTFTSKCSTAHLCMHGAQSILTHTYAEQKLI